MRLVEIRLSRNEEFFARSRKTSICAEAYTKYAAQANVKSDAEIAEKDLSYAPLLLVIIITPIQTRMVPAQRSGVTTSPRKYWERNATRT